MRRAPHQEDRGVLLVLPDWGHAGPTHASPVGSTGGGKAELLGYFSRVNFPEEWPPERRQRAQAGRMNPARSDPG